MQTNVDALTHQIQSLRNGFTRHHTLPRHSKHANLLHHQHFQTIPQVGHNPQNMYEIHNIGLVEQGVVENNISSHKKSGGSDSGSSTGSLGEISPPNTPNTTTRGSYQTYKQMSANRLNGRPDKLQTGGTIVFQQQQQSSNNIQQINQNFIPSNEMIVAANLLSNNNNINNGNGSNNNFVTNSVMMAAPSIVSPSSSGTTLVANPIMLQQATQQITTAYSYHPQQHIATTSRPPLLSHPASLPPPPTGPYRHSDVIYPYQIPNVHTVAFIAPTPSLRSSPSSIQSPSSVIQTVAPFAPTNKLSCFNCGATSHTGRECQDPSMEDVTRNSIYKLDFNASSASSPTQSTSIHSDSQIINDTQQTQQSQQQSSIPSNSSSK